MIDRRIRVVQLIPDLRVGGAERMLLSLATGLDRTRFDLKVVSLYDRSGSAIEAGLDAAGVEIATLGKQVGFDASMFGRVAAVLQRLEPDIVHTHRAVFPYALPALRRAGLPHQVIHTVHNVADKEVADRFRRTAHWLAFRGGVAPVAICEFVASSLERFYGVAPRAIIPNGIPVKEFVLPSSEGRAWRAGNGVPDRATVFVSVARIAPQKNPLALVRAFAALGERDAVLLLLGDGPLCADVAEEARALGVANRVRLLGTRADVPQILAAADVFALSSVYEGHPLSAMEAMAAGKPVVATAVGGVPEVVRSGENGLLVPSGDVDALSAAMRRLLSDAALRASLGANAARAAERAFDVSRMIAAYDRLYGEVLEAARVPARRRSSAAHAAEARRARRRRTRVVQLIPSLGTGGAERVLAELATGLDRARYDVTVVSYFPPCGSSIERALAEHGVEVITLGKRLGFDPKMFFRVAATLRRLRPDVVHTHRPVFPYALPWILGRLRGRVVHTVHSDAEKEVPGRLRRLSHWLAFRAGVAPVAICGAVAKSVRDVHGVAPRAVIPNGVEVRAFGSPPAAREHWRAANGIPADAVVIVSVARLQRPKDPVALVEAFAAMQRPGALLLLAGDGPLRDEVESRARALGVADRVRLLGTLSDVPGLVAASDVFALPSRYEGHPLSVMEAMAAGTPVVATAVGGVPEIVEHGRDGLLVPPGDIAALSAALQRLVDDAALRRALGAAARRKAVEAFDVSRMVEGYDALYQEIVAGRGLRSEQDAGAPRALT